MTKTILITGATDGIGLLTAKTLADEGHIVLLHGRSAKKLEAAAKEVGGDPETFLADLSRLEEVAALAEAIRARHDRIDVLINNAGVYKVAETHTPEGLDTRFVVNTLAPYLLTQKLLPIIPADGRVVNLSSAAQAPVGIAALRGKQALDQMQAYAQSKLAITIWTQALARAHPDGPVFIAVNPGSLLASKMVKEGFGVAGNDLSIGADILCRAALSDEFAEATGRYFDNDSGGFAEPHSAASDKTQVAAVMEAIRDLTGATDRE
ncbi:SDR family NAD(P)-dependent oxidoreductase [Roseovarius pelagicus]|uniref:SDR family NAD(P)-dependent oxidoreductase n=1 Tax=Roseovarius pelagicus TaxID=2980108 RepID=A0ABY6D8C3_9RHOB|nr:SDR family NAD(P)-dependent oxidoreductase [Roseovarius pelagicus]UXX82377.1 SDR family NAD(P)-dependent oxidoreductase [Roseovarius pelagicus]